MGADHLANRSNWQYGARVVGDAGENTFAAKIAEKLPTHYTVEVKPAKLLVYNDVNGILLDVKITNTQTGKSLFVEIKTGNNGGNAHERAFKFLSCPLKESVRDLHDTPNNPFFIVFMGTTFTGERENPGQPFSKKNRDGSTNFDKRGRPTKINPQKYIDELSLVLSEEQYAIVAADFANMEEIAKQIMEIL